MEEALGVKSTTLASISTDHLMHKAADSMEGVKLINMNFDKSWLSLWRSKNNRSLKFLDCPLILLKVSTSLAVKYINLLYLL